MRADILTHWSSGPLTNLPSALALMVALSEIPAASDDEVSLCVAYPLGVTASPHFVALYNIRSG
ncbi:hypothetical protein CO655_23635 [Rhizobium sp. M1]|nr:hypothetical protein CO655_23635 [Rhizobium sp. M1]